MKKSFSYKSFPGGLEGTKKLGDFFQEAADAGFEAVELYCSEAGKITPKTTERQCATIRRKAERAELEIASLSSGIYWTSNLGSNKVTERNRAEQLTKKMLRVAGWLGTDALFFIPGAVNVFFDPGSEAIPYDMVLARAKQGIKRILRTAEQCNVALCVANVWNKFLLSPIELRDFIDSFDSRFVASYLNIGNVLAIGYPEHWIRILGKRIRRVHCNDYRIAAGIPHGACDPLEGDVNWPQVVKALKTIGYDGYCTVDVPPLNTHFPEVRIRNVSHAMDAVFGM